MRWRSVLIGVVGVVSTLLVAVPAARADYTTNPQVLTIPLTPTNWSPSTPSLLSIDPMTFAKFDASQYSSGGQTATLLGVEVRLDYEFDNTLSMRFSNLSTITVTASGSLTLNNNPNTAALIPTQTFANSETMTATPSTVLNKTVTFPTKVITGSVSSPTGGFTDSATLAQFAGSGTIALPVFAQATAVVTSSSGNGFGSSVTLASAVVTIVYRYAVPEPASLTLAGLGLVGLFGVCRSRKRLPMSGSKAA